jgi:bifunctional non-homologous end joining protein LigD
MSSPFDVLSADERELLRPAPAPERAELMKAVLSDKPFSDPEWIFERKLDGIRCLAVRTGERVRMLSRNNLDLGARFPELLPRLGAEACERYAIDGEIVAFEGSATSFARLAQRAHRPVKLFYYVFDVLWLEGEDIRALPLRARKRLLRRALSSGGALRISPHRNGAGEAAFERACRRGWEGLVAKRSDSPYRSSRSRDWLKLKCTRGQELVIGGYTPPRGSRSDFGALLVGYYAGDGELRYAGKVGTGFDQQTLEELGQRLRATRTSDPPFAEASEIRERGAQWVEPELVAQVAFTEWTGHGRLRHPSFLGLREDKSAREVVREQ